MIDKDFAEIMQHLFFFVVVNSLVTLIIYTTTESDHPAMAILSIAVFVIALRINYLEYRWAIRKIKELEDRH